MDMDFIHKMLATDMPEEHQQLLVKALMGKVSDALGKRSPEDRVGIGFDLAKEHTRELLMILTEQKDPYVCHGAASRFLGGLLRLSTVSMGADLARVGESEELMSAIYVKCEKVVREVLENELRAAGIDVSTEYLKDIPPEPSA